MREAETWKMIFGEILLRTYEEKLRKLIGYMEEKNEVLSRDINDLEDVRIAMKCLGEIRNDFISLDIELIAIEETYALMSKYSISFTQEEQNAVDNLRYDFTNLLSTVIF